MTEEKKRFEVQIRLNQQPLTLKVGLTIKNIYLFNKHILFFLKLFQSLGNLRLESIKKGILPLFLFRTSANSNGSVYYKNAITNTSMSPNTNINLSVSSSVMINLSRCLGSALLSHQNLCVFVRCSGLQWEALSKFPASSACVSKVLMRDLTCSDAPAVLRTAHWCYCQSRVSAPPAHSSNTRTSHHDRDCISLPQGF